jgi:hypothetical protein
VPSEPTKKKKKEAGNKSAGGKEGEFLYLNPSVIDGRTLIMDTMRLIAAWGFPAPWFSQKLCTPRRRAELTAYS